MQKLLLAVGWIGLGLSVLLLGSLFMFIAWNVWNDFTGPPYGSDGPHSGWTAVWIDDVDGDAVPDIALKTRFEPPSQQGWGAVRLLSGASGRQLRVLHGLNINEQLHDQIGSAGDLDGDGRGEIWWKSDSQNLHFGTGPQGSDAKSLPVNPSDAAVATLGDVDGDDQIDYLVSGFPKSDLGVDTISVVSSSTWMALWTLSRPELKKMSWPPFAWNASDAGDVNTDGIADAAIVDENGRVLLVDGRSGSVLRELESRVGWTLRGLSALGDVDGHAGPELAVHVQWSSLEPLSELEGAPDQIRVLSSADGALLKTIRVPVLVGSVFSPGDVNGDGLLDVAWLGDRKLEVIRVLDEKVLHSIQGAWSIPGRGDYDNDGCDDLLATRNIHLDEGDKAPEDLWRKGRVEIVSGKDGSILRTFDEAVLPPVIK
jgi:hypothetical protein